MELAKRPVALKRALQVVDVDHVHTVKGEAHRLGDLLQFDERGAAVSRARAACPIARATGGEPARGSTRTFQKTGKFRNADLADHMHPEDCKAMTEGGRMSSLPTQPTDQAQYAEKRAGIAGTGALTSETPTDSATCI